MLSRSCVVISGCWPGKYKGYEIACNCTLDFLKKKYNHIYYIGPSDEKLEDEFRQHHDKVVFICANFYRAAKFIRFFKSLFSLSPAICQRFHQSLVEVLGLIGDLNCKELDFFYEDIPASFFLKKLKKQYPNSTHIVRSHNVVYKGFQGMSNKGNLINRLAWKHELKKILNFEKLVATTSDVFICISDDDRSEYSKLGINVTNVLGVFLEESKIKSKGKIPNHLIFIGTADLRKGAALRYFITFTWPKLRSIYPELEFHIGGNGTEIFSDKDNGVFGYGFLSDESEIFNKGKVFINPQVEGSGIKVKSLVALNQKCCLVSTNIGIEGISLKNRKEVLCSIDIDGMLNNLIWLLSHEENIVMISTNGKVKLNNLFSKKSFFESANLIWNKNVGN